MPDVKVAISDQFLEAFSEVPKTKQKKVRRFMTKFRRDPTLPGINYEKIEGAKDSKLRSVRIDQAYRGIVMTPDAGNVYMLLWVAHHDDAYQWARTRTVQIHPDTGSLQVIPLEEGALPIAHGGAPPEEAGGGETDLFAEHRDRELVRLGVPEELMPLVRSIDTEERLDAVQAHLPEEAYEALFLLAAGYTQREVDNELAYAPEQAAVDTGDYVKALERPHSKRRFAVVDDEKELSHMLDAPLETWRVFLHPTQQRLVEKDVAGPIRVLGGAGTGKTVVAMHRAVWLAENVFTDPEDLLLFTTFTRNLAADLRENLRLLATPDVVDRIEVVNLDAWVSRFLRRCEYDYTIDYSGQAEDLWEKALMVGPEGRDRRFLRNEWEQVTQPNGIRSERDYMRVSRTGRGTPLQRSQRAAVWPVFDEYQSLLDEHRLRERAGALRDARRMLEAGEEELPYRSILVDEAQDMGRQAFMLIREMIPGGDRANDLFIVGDAHQRIYDRTVVLKHCGINIVGRSHKLRINYRTTEENRRWAVRLLEGAEYGDLDGGVDDQAGYTSLMHGQEPRVRTFDTFQAEVEALVGFLKAEEDSGEWLRDTCLIARTASLLDNYRGALRAADIDTYPIKKDRAEDRSAPGVRLATMHRAKGLEFERVLVAGVSDGIVPLSTALSDAEDEATREQIRKRERSLLYVSATRAKRSVIVTAHDTPSPWLSSDG